MRDLIQSRQVSAVHDISDAGLIQTLAEMALASTGLGANAIAMDHIALFAEDQARYLVSAGASQTETILAAAREANIPAEVVGQVTLEPSLIVEGRASISLDELRLAHEGWFPAYMASKAT